MMQKSLCYTYFIIAVFVCIIDSCDNAKEHTAAAIRDRDSVSMMTSYGVNTLISDSGIMRYRIIAERWEVNDVLSQPRWMFKRGLFLEQFDEKFHVQTYVQSDTAYYFTRLKLWHLWGNVHIKTKDGLYFTSDELYWDQNRHELYSNLHSLIITPERELEGAYFTSDEQMRHYNITNTKGSFQQTDMFGDGNSSSHPVAASNIPVDTVSKRQAIIPRKR